MIVNANDDWRIVGTAKCFTCQQRHDHKGEIRWESRTHHDTFESAAEYLIELRLRDDPIELNSLRAGLEYVRGIREQMRQELLSAAGGPWEVRTLDVDTPRRRRSGEADVRSLNTGVLGDQKEGAPHTPPDGPVAA